MLDPPLYGGPRINKPGRAFRRKKTNNDIDLNTLVRDDWQDATNGLELPTNRLEEDTNGPDQGANGHPKGGPGPEEGGNRPKNDATGSDQGRTGHEGFFCNDFKPLEDIE
ncbi:hypothetical protein Pyn_00298 [Prunus yedoensis var. nudiflora]|uniref:Uncharacterized protein n=1 Tax=Prunus yedoensis var. nudiflora TaxID=2094558 RepID=A0A314UET8_PRUYE|nr:hypothetical protein Pyn_00298 [Prunus yedoensis var. nudiflora]